MPMSAALVSHLVGYNMTWSTTVKTVQKSNFFLQIPIIWRRFWPQLVFFGLCVVSEVPNSIPRRSTKCMSLGAYSTYRSELMILSSQ
jgi:hypothetical protein